MPLFFFLTKLYFDKYPLMTSKYLNYLCFLQTLDYLERPLMGKEIIEIQNIKNSMNNKRIYYNWDHLNTFYNQLIKGKVAIGKVRYLLCTIC